MPQLVKLHKEYKDQGFVVIATHAQSPKEKDRALAMMRKLKADITVTSMGSINTPEKLQGIPQAYLFDSKGELVEAGRPSSMKNSIVSLIESSPHYLIADRPPQKLKKVADALKKTPVWGSIIKKLVKEQKKKGEVAEEAEFMLERLRGYGEKQLTKARELETEDALAAQVLYAKIAKNFKGDDVAEKASDRTKELKKDKEFQAELKACKAAAQILAMTDKLVAVRDKISLESKSNKKTARTIMALTKRFLSKYGESKVADKLTAELEGFGFEF